MLEKKIKLLTITLLTLLSSVSLFAAKNVSYNATVCGDAAYLFGCDVYTAAASPQLSFGDSTVTLHLLFGMPQHVSYEAMVAPGQSYLFGCTPYLITTDTDVDETFASSVGCDSTVTVKLKLQPAPQPVHVEYDATIEQGQAYLFGCNVFETDGDYDAVYTDSTVTVHLTVNTAQPVHVEYDATIEQGQAYLFGCNVFETDGDYDAVYGDSTVTVHLTVTTPCPAIPVVTVVDSIACEGDLPFLWRGHIPVANDTVNCDDTLKNVNGCDSIIRLNLAVQRVILDSVVTKTICKGESVEWKRRDGTVIPGTFDVTGVYHDTVRYANAPYCDSLRFTLDLTVKTPTVLSDDTTTVVKCNGESYYWDRTDENYNVSGFYRDTAYLDCDTLFYTLNLTVLAKADTVRTAATICYNGEYEWLDNDGNQLKTFELMKESKNDTVLVPYIGQSCDSLVYTLKLTVLQKTDTVTSASIICEGEDYIWLDKNGDQLYKFEKVAEDVDSTIVVPFANYADCDSVVYTLSLKVNKHLPDEVENVRICKADLPYTWRGKDYSTSDTYYDDVKYVGTGCDSIRYTLNLTVLGDAKSATRDTTICDGDVFTWIENGVDLGSYDKAGTYEKALPYAGATCDSIVYTLNLKVDKIAVFEYDEYKVYYGYTYESVNGRKYVITKDTTIYEYDQNVRGCDSVEYTQKVTVLAIPKAARTIRYTVCAGDTYVAAGGPREITGDSTWVDSVRFELKTPIDSFFTYNIYTYRSPSTLSDTIINSVRAVCGSPLDTLAAQTRIEQYLRDNFWTIHVDTVSAKNGGIQWLVSRAGQYVPGAWNILSGAQGEVDFKLVITDGCGQVGEFGKVIPVEDPESGFVDNILVPKYGHWLLMLHVNDLIKAGYVFTEEDVDWYQIVNGVETKLDHHGYYYTVDEELVGRFYAVIHTASEFGCNTTIKSNTVDWSVPSNAPLRLVPNIGDEGTIMRLENLNPFSDYQIYGYNESGKLVSTMSVSGQATTEIRAEGSQGLYMLRVVTDDKVETLRYIIK